MRKRANQSPFYVTLVVVVNNIEQYLYVQVRDRGYPAGISAGSYVVFVKQKSARDIGASPQTVKNFKQK
jgi:hypothetical protein